MDLDTIIKDRFLSSTIKIYKYGKTYHTEAYKKADAEFDVKILAVSDLEINDVYDGNGDDVKVTLTLDKADGLTIDTIDIWAFQGNDTFQLTPIKK